MGYSPVTPFRRAVDAALLERDRRQAANSLPPQGINKWEALREIGVARAALGLTDRDIAVLQALISFHPQTILAGNRADLVVHASNEAICARLNGMPCSTMRRHLAALVAAGVVARRDSPNGKRYARQTAGGKVAFGFDLTPLVQRHEEFCAMAEAVRAKAERFTRLRETVSLMRRDLAGLALWGEECRPDLGLWPRLQDLAALTARALRRKLDMEDLAALEAALAKALTEARDILEPVSAELSSNHAQNEQHHQNSDTELKELEDRKEHADAAAAPDPDRPAPRLPLGLVLSACPEIQTYAETPLRHWHQLVRLAETVRPMMGISPDGWNEAREALGPEEAAVVLAAILQRFDQLKSPGAYLRSLVRKALEGAFSPGPMVMALMKGDRRAA
ncbi:plasmid replication protein RepC [Gemmobacter denitrificans]|uniref:Plasmid replication protein RepC n=1 Tax=Gemmobacter denitrificans TaxID=3123040 RepID=A0ABU8BZ84_9RHOB